MSFTERTLAAFSIEDVPGTPVANPRTGALTTGYNPSAVGAHSGTIPQADQFVLYDSPSPVQADIEAIQLNPSTGDLGPADFVPGRKIYTSEFQFHPFASGVAESPPHAMDFLRVCGYRRIDVLATTAPTTAPTMAIAAGGSFAAGFYKYAIARVKDSSIASNEITPSAMSKLTLAAAEFEVTAGHVTAGTRAVTVTFVAADTIDGAAAGSRTFVFRSLKATVGATAAPYYFVGETGATATSFIDYGPDTSLGVPYPGGGTPLGIGALASAKGVWYIPDKENFESASMAIWNDAYVHLLKGARGNVSQLQLRAGDVGRLTMQIRGLYTDNPIPEANPSFIARSTPPKFESALCSILPEGDTAGYFTTAVSPRVKQVTLMTGTQLNERRDANQANSMTEIAIAKKFQPRFGINFEVDTGYNAIKAMGDGKLAHSGFTIGGTTAGTRITVAVARMRYQTAPPYGDADGYNVHDANWVPGAGGGRDFMSFLHW